MPFDRLHENLQCDCLLDAHESLDNHYLRITKNIDFTENDFKSLYEKGRKFRGSQSDFKKICMHRGISLLKSKDNLIQMHNMYPHLGNHWVDCSFKQPAGKIESTQKNNDTHHTLYKDDNFNIQMVNIHSKGNF